MNFKSLPLFLAVIFCISIFIMPSAAFSAPNYATCFTPGQNCVQFIVTAINQAKSTIYMQAYSFTSKPIADALIKANKRGVIVNIILDKSQFTSKYTCTNYLMKNNIKVYDDYKPQIAHNKIIIIDGYEVLTGSFNYTTNAQARNTENVISINDETIANKYLMNWQSRLKQSK